MREGVKVHPFAFPRAERLPNKRETERLFRKGTRLFSFPYRALFLVGTEGEAGIKMVFIAPKRLCKLSVERHAHIGCRLWDCARFVRSVICTLQSR